MPPATHLFPNHHGALEYAWKECGAAEACAAGSYMSIDRCQCVSRTVDIDEHALIDVNSICAGGIFTFPLMSPVLAEHLKLTQPQLTTIVLA